MSDGRTWGTIIGGVIGYFTGGIGFAAGAAIGGAVGGLLEPKQRTETNRIDDIKVSLSKYSDGIPETWGNNIPAATWVWSTYIIQIGEEQEAGKGGGAVNTNYRQFIHGLLCLGRTPPPGTTVTIRKAYVNGKLTYDGSSGLSPGQALATTENPFANIVLFDGQDGQLPIPIIEAYEGVGNVPAFTGRLSLFVFGLECPGGRIPQLSFEICINAVNTSEVLAGDTFTVESAPWSSSNAPLSGDPVIAFQERSTIVDGYAVANKVVDVYAIGFDSLTKLGEIVPPDTAYNFNALSGSADVDAICYRSVTASAFVDQGINDVVLQDGTRKRFEVASLAFGQSTSCWSKKGDRFAIAGDANQSSDMAELFDWESGTKLGTITGIQPLGLFVSDACVWVTYTDGGADKIQARSLDDFSLLAEADLPPELEPAYPSYFRADGSDLMSYTSNISLLSLWRIVLDGASISFDMEKQASMSAPIITDRHAINVGGQMVVGVGGDTTKTMFVVRFGAITPAEAPVADLIESQCERAGLAGKLDIATVDDSFWGYTFNKSPASARSNIAPLMTYSALGVVEEDGVLRFFHREDKTSVATIAYDELGCAEDGSEPGDPFPVAHTNAQELPRSLTLSYNDPNFDYQVSTVKVMMLTADSVLDATETLDMAISGDRAATIARRLLLERWLAQNTRSCAVSRKFAFLSAGDVITVLSKTGSYGDWMISKATDTGARIEIECFPADSDLLIQSVPGPEGFQGQQIQPLPPSTRMVFGDWAMLRDADNNAGPYVAMEGLTASGWNGAELFVGDDDTNLQSRGVVMNAAVIGFSESALGAWSFGTVDETNLMTVNIGDDALNSITREVLLAGETNVFALGAQGRWEIAQFQRADDLGGGRYILSGLRRGLRGTEYATGSHAIGDAFVLLSVAGALKPSVEIGAIGQTRSYRAVSNGRSFNSAASQTYAATGEPLRPFSPVRLRKSISSNDITLTWDRRTRMSENALTGLFPLGEATEAYEVEIYSSSAFTTVKRVIQAYAGRTAVYISAQQITDFGANQTTLYVRAYQMSDSVGRGHALEAVI